MVLFEFWEKKKGFVIGGEWIVEMVLMESGTSSIKKDERGV